MYMDIAKEEELAVKKSENVLIKIILHILDLTQLQDVLDFGPSL